MPIKINSTGGGSVSIDVPSTGGTYTLTAPANNATIFTTDGGAITGNVAFTSNNVTIGGQTASPFGAKNRIINGDMSVWQRTTGNTAMSTTQGTYATADRWSSYVSTDASGYRWMQSTSAPLGFQYSMKFGRAQGSTGAYYVYLTHALESVNSIDLAGQTVTLSFWMKSGANFSGSALGARIYEGTGTDQSSATLGNATWTGSTYGNVDFLGTSISTTWTRYSITRTIGTTATQLGLMFYWLPSGTAGADDYLYITGVQLEPGPVATPFEKRPYGQELALCQRYFQLFYTGTGAGYNSQPFATGMAYSTTAAATVAFLSCPFRAVPTVTVTGTLILWTSVGGSSNVTALTIDGCSTPYIVRLNATVASGLSAGNATFLSTSGPNNYMWLSAEL